MKQVIEYLGLLVFAVVALLGVLVTAPLDLTGSEIALLLVSGVLISIVFLALYEVRADRVESGEIGASEQARR